MAENGRRGVFLVGLAAGAAATWLLATGKGRALCSRLTAGRRGPEPDQLVDAESSAWQDAADADERSEALRRKIDETRRRLREQVGLPPEA